MGFFSELKNDLSQAVNTLMPDDKAEETVSLDKDKANANSNAGGDRAEKIDLDSMLNRLDEIKLDDINPEEPVEKEVENTIVQEPVSEPVIQEPVNEAPAEKTKNALEMMAELKEKAAMERVEDDLVNLEEKIEEETMEEVKREVPVSAIETVNTYSETVAETAKEYPAEEESYESENTTNYGGYDTMDFAQQTPTDETACITEGMSILGDVQTTGSLELVGKVTGNITCLGKLNVTGEISGDSTAAEIYADAARITGEVRSKGSVKVGQSTVIVGNIYGSSAVIAGAVKGDIDVHGPVVLDTTAIVMGNIKSQSVQINNGAVIEGMCSQAYADVNPSEFFETLRNR